MPDGAFAIILDEEEKVLIALRDDMPLWNLIGGMVDEGESFEQAVIREVKEETGLDVEIIRMVGDYTKQRNGIIVKVYLCRVISGNLGIKDEGVMLKYFKHSELPANMSQTQKERIYDYFKKSTEVIKRFELKKVPNLEMLSGLKNHEIDSLDFWKAHPRVKEKRRLGMLKYYPE